MTSRIRVLPDEVADRIAAGEVIEGPFSVVKELLENALDAQAGEVTIEVKGGGSDLIRVTDNGVGMSRDDSLAAFNRFATSKLAEESDLVGISTLGFRGEALPSIASVSRVRMVTSERDSVEGTEVVLVGGTVRDVRPAGRAPGTTMEVSSLFFNTPARKKFLKSPRTEIRRLTEVVTDYAILYPNVRFDMSIDGKVSLRLPPARSLKERVAAIVGSAIVKEMLPLELEEDGYRMLGLVGKPSVARAHATHHLVAVNGRPVRSRVLAAAIRAGYGERLPRSRYPLVFIGIDADGALIDVNVHPTKSDVRFGQQQRVFALLEGAVREAISSVDSSPALVIPGRRSSGEGTASVWRRHSRQGSGATVRADQLTLPTEIREAPNGAPASPPGQDATARQEVEDPVATSAAVGAESKFWQLHNQYILVQTREGALLIDQHAAHERVVYERIRKTLSGLSDAGPSQQLLFPVAIELSPAEWQMFEEVEPLLSRAGFSVRPMSGRSILLEAVPSALTKWSHEQIIHDILSDVPTGKPSVRELTDSIAKTFACKTTIKAGDPLSLVEMRSLVDQLFATELPYSCPHGRPTFVRLALADLDKRFGRT